ncbi:LytTR family DNA-binding domain-containing protein [Sulfitobacter donghicola]|nr:LytTR family DNA-binding domain-containing protein [Sulfitobacter donghicola]
MHFTLRELTKLRVPFLIWLALTAVAAVAGPFGTLDVMGVAGRALYWGAIIGGSVWIGVGASKLSQRYSLVGRVMVWSGFSLLLSILVHGINALVFNDMSGWGNWLYLFAIVGVVTAAVQLVIWSISPEPAEEVVEKDTFGLRLPIDVRGPLVRIEAQDHYLNVVTSRGNALILMRLGDAMEELSGKGIQVHRSHWIALDAVAKHRREKGRDILMMQDGAEVPVSRSFKAAAQDAGLF